MTLFKSAATPLLLALILTAANAAPDPRQVHVDMMETCHKGLVAWHRMPPKRMCDAVNTPQVKIFDGTGRLRFIGSALDAIQWAKSGMPRTPIPKDVVVRDVASEARIMHVAVPPPGRGWVTYYGTNDCEPCVRHLAMFRAEVMPKLDPATTVTVVDIGAPGE